MFVPPVEGDAERQNRVRTLIIPEVDDDVLDIPECLACGIKYLEPMSVVFTDKM